MLRKTVIENGTLEGLPCDDPRITVYKGIPYAKPPVGELRWKAPEKPESWNGVRIADRFAPMAYQDLPGSNPNEFYSKEIHPASEDYAVSEDCLYLNVWTPAQTLKDNLAVYIWIHGGGMKGGYSYEMEFDGERMARQGIIFVTVAYRLNIFGFLCHEELSAENPDGGHANFGILDCLEAVRWVKRNIAAFGGDPERITLGGQSAGAMCVLSMYTTPLAEGLISGVIMQSGGGLRSMGYQQKCQPLAEAEKKGKSFLEALGVSCIAEARKVDVKKIFEVYKEGPQEVGYYHAVIDGYLLKEDPTDTELSDKPPRIPYLLGSNSGECPGTPASPCLPENIKQFEESVHNIFGNKADEFLTLCNVQSMDDVLKIMRGDVFNTRTVGVRAYASVQAEQKRKSYVYFFDHHIPGEDNPGAYHGIELWFVFNSINRCWRPFGGKDYDLARKISGYWINFVKNGDPNGLDMAGETLPEWCSYSNDNPFIMEFSDEPRQMIKEIDPLLEFRIQHHLHRL